MLRALCLLLFASTAQAADITGLDLVRSKADGARVDAIATVSEPVHEGATALRFEIRPGDCTPADCAQNRERVELKSLDTERPGTRSRTRWSFYLPEEFALVWPARQFIAQFHQEGGPPAMLFGLEPEGLVFESRFGAPKRQVLIPIAELRGRWHTLDADIVWSKTKGRVVIRCDGDICLSRLQPTMSRAQAYFKVGLYRAHLDRNPEGAQSTQTMFVDSIQRTPKQEKWPG